MTWALGMILPDFKRLIEPLASFGFRIDNDGLVTDVRAASPAFQAGLRSGDQLDLGQMRCRPLNTLMCSSAMAALGGMALVNEGQEASLLLVKTPNKSARQINLLAKRLTYNRWLLAVLVLDQLAGILVVLAAGWLVWTRPGAMTWGFFLYVIWFNPGQSAAYYALLLHYSPAALLTQNIAGAVAQGAGSAGFIWFAIRAPTNATTSRWRTLERTLPVLAVFVTLVLSLSYANLFGYPTETLTRAGVLSALIVAAGAFMILLARQGELPPQDYQRLRWVIWGCVVGLPALVIADIGTGTTLFDPVWNGNPPPEQLWGLLYLVNGVLCLFVSEAIRRPHVVAVSIPLRRVTILGLLLSLPILFLHQEIDHVREAIRENVDLPAWVWVAIASAVLFLVSKLHDSAVHVLDRLFNYRTIKAGERLGEAILHAKTAFEIESQLVQGARKALSLASASLFREDSGVFQRSMADDAWDDTTTQTLDPNDPIIEAARVHRPFNVTALAGTRSRLPVGLMRPILAIPVGDRLRCLALSLYGPHLSGNDLNHDERTMLAELADKAASVLMKLNDDELRGRIATLESQLRAVREDSATAY
ncbi:MAG: hypothetical protein WBF47_23630 [Xanthobacteraceae bacterium]|jgi:hypothetical protein